MGSVATRTTDLTALADEINAEHRACDAALREGLNHAVRAGELLTEAKGRVKHGEWGSWIRDNFDGSARTAQAYMKVARDVPKLDGAKAQRVADLSLRGALNELAEPVAQKTPEEPPSLEPLEQTTEEPEDPMTALRLVLKDDECEWYDFERDVPLTKADLAYLVHVIGKEPAVGRVAAVLFFGEDPGGYPKLNPHGVRDPDTAVLIGRVRQECGEYTYHQLFEQVETTDVPLARHDQAQLKFLLKLAREGHADAYTADIVARVGARWKLRYSVAQLSFLADLAESGVSDEETAEMVQAALSNGKPVYSMTTDARGA